MQISYSWHNKISFRILTNYPYIALNKNERDGSKENYEVNYKLYVYIFQPFFSILGKRELKKCNKGEIRNKIAMYQRTNLAS